MARPKQGHKDSMVMMSTHRVRDLDPITTRKYPGYLIDILKDLKDLPEYDNVGKTEREADLTELGLDCLRFSESLLRYKTLWNEMRHSKIGSSLEFRQRSREYTDYFFIHPNKQKGKINCTKDIKSQLSEIAEDVMLYLGDVGCIALTLGAKQKCDETGGKAKMTRPVIYDEMVEELENFYKFIERQIVILKLNFSDILGVWEESDLGEIDYKPKWK